MTSLFIRKNTLIVALLVLFSLSAFVSAADILTYRLVPAADYAKIPQLAAARDYGVKQALAQAITQKKLANVPYTRVATNSVYNATNGTNVFYKFNLTYTNKNKDIFKPVFVIQYNTVTKTQFVKSSSASIKYGNATSATNTTKPVTPKPTPTPTPTPKPSNNSATPYVKVPIAKYNDSAIHSSLMFGVNYVANLAIAQGNLPKATYKIVAINSISQLKLATSTNYKYDVNIQDLNKTRTAQALFTVKYVNATAPKSIVTYTYNVLPYSV